VHEPRLSDPFIIDDEYRWNLIERKAQQARALRAVSLLRQHGIESILIKGVAAGIYYPSEKLRDCVDVDLAVGEADHANALEIARSAEADGFAIDLHKELRHLDTVDWQDLMANSRELKFDGGSVRTLRPEDHLRVLCVHWLTDGGSNRDRLWDIYYCVENRPEGFDWERFLAVVSARRRRWLVCTIGLAHKYLGLKIDDTPVSDLALDLPAWLTTTVEREWAVSVKLQPLENTLGDPSMLMKQVLKRLRPNPIWATVDLEGDFDARTRVFYQAANWLRRIPSSYQRITNTIRLQRRERGK
jgi:hypothetical protein